MLFVLQNVHGGAHDSETLQLSKRNKTQTPKSKRSGKGTKITLAVPESEMENLIASAASLMQQYPNFEGVRLPNDEDSHGANVALRFAENIVHWKRNRINKLKIFLAEMVGVRVDLIKLCGVVKGSAILLLRLPGKKARVLEKSKDDLMKELKFLDKIKIIPVRFHYHDINIYQRIRSI